MMYTLHCTIGINWDICPMYKASELIPCIFFCMHINRKEEEEGETE